ncbi:Desaturase [Burkholderiales bacterium 8X]|nr:Desaturase [Burkholderiales bacterium 8X]
MKLAIVGAGWAGLACAIESVRAGHRVTLFEASRTLGGRARALEVHPVGQSPLLLDNGQHILIGAYAATLGLMQELGIDLGKALHRMPLVLRFPDGGGIETPRLPPPLDLLAGIFRATGWSWGDKARLIRIAAGWRRQGFRCAPETTVAELCAPLGARVVRDLVEPLCVSALNTPIERASGAVFLRVLHDALFAGAGGADLLLPRVDLGALLPDPASTWLEAHGARLRTGTRVQAIAAAEGSWEVDEERFDRVILACPPWEAARLAAAAGSASAEAWSARADALEHEAIATVYARGGVRLPAPLIALRTNAEAPAQFVFDRSWLGGPDGLLAFVVSASPSDRELLQQQVMRQAADQLGLRELQPVKTVVERRATFACTPGLVRPGAVVAPGLLACGDYVDGPYPATLEGAVRSGLAAARHPQGQQPSRCGPEPSR